MVNDKILLTPEEFYADYDADPGRRARWEARALARAVAFAVERYRMENRLSQRALAAKLGVRQPHVARLELGEHSPSIEMLGRLASVLGLRFIVDVVPPGGRPEELTLPRGLAVVHDATAPDGSRVLVATG